MKDIYDIETYTIDELKEALVNIDREIYPERAIAIENAIAEKEPQKIINEKDNTHKYASSQTKKMSDNLIKNNHTVFRLLSPYSKEKVLDLIREHSDTALFFGSDEKKVKGRIKRSHFAIRKKIEYRNSFQTEIKGQVKSNGSGSEIVCSSGMNDFVVSFVRFFIDFSIFLGIIGFFVGLYQLFIDKGNNSDVWILFLVPPIIPVFGYFLMKFGQYIARYEEEFLINFLIHTLNAKKVDE